MSGSDGGYGKWLVLGGSLVVATTAGYLAYRYLTDPDEDEEPSTSSAFQFPKAQPAATPSTEAAPKSAAPRLPARPKAGAKSVAAAGTSGAASSNRVCACCSKALTGGLPLRCSHCKSVYYCSQDCQKKAWPEHKTSCKAAPKSAGGSDAEAAPANGASADSSAATASSQQQQPKPRTMDEALAQMLEESASKKGEEEKLEGMFEQAVMLFLRAEYRKAIAQLERVKSTAQQKGDKGVEGEVHKWLGHCHNKLGEPKKAEACFNDGVAFAKSADLGKLEVDCLAGLGIMYRTQGEPEKAVQMLTQALELAEKAGDLDSTASTLVNLGSALMSTDPDAAIQKLAQAVELREAAIEKFHEAGERGNLATAVMEHANAMVNLAGALYVMKRLTEAKVAFIRALEVFELVEDVDKVSKVLVNLANMCGVQMKDDADSRIEAAVFRQRLIEFLKEKGLRAPSTDEPCAICMEPLNLLHPSPPGKEILTLACLHCFHDECWNKWSEKEIEKGSKACCATCKQPVNLYAD